MCEFGDLHEIRVIDMHTRVFVNGRSRPAIMEDMEKRIKRGDIKQEKKDAIQAMCDIALNRASKMGAT